MSSPYLCVTLRTTDRNDWPDWYLDRRHNEYFIGRSEKNAFTTNWITLTDQYISRKHCRLHYQSGQGWILEDLGSANGTRIHGKKLEGSVPLQRAEMVQLGKAFLLLKPVEQLPEGYQQDEEEDPTLASPETKTLTGGIETSRQQANRTSNDQTMIFNASEFTVANPSTDTPGGGISTEDATVLRPLDAQSGPSSQQLRDDAATVIGRSFADDADDDSTRISPSTTGETTLEDATVMRPASAAQPAEGDAQTVINPEAASGLGAGGASGVEDHDATIIRSQSDTDLNLDFLDEVNPAAGSSSPQASPEAAAGSDSPNHGADHGAHGLGFTGIAAEIVDSGLASGALVQRLFDQCRREGGTFFRRLVESNELDSLASIYRLVAQSTGLELIEDENQLYNLAKSEDWLPHELAEELGVLMLTDDESGQSRCACIDPYDIQTQDWTRRQTGQNPMYLLTLPSTLVTVNQRLKRSNVDEDDAEIGYSIDFSEEAEESLREELIDADIPQMVNYFLHRASVAGASDVHVEPGEENTVVRMRVNGVLYEDATLPSVLHPEISSRLKIISEMDVAEKRRPQDGRIGLSIRGKPIDVRVSSFPTVYGEKIVMRLLDRSALRPSPEHLGLRSSDLRLIMDAIHAPYGLVMLCGPTGSGKTTTLYSCLGSVDKDEKNVVTVEDPVEYRLKGVHQMQVNHKINLSFASGLRTILRQDPDVIMIGECRDAETAGMAVQAALTGHVVFSTIHTNDAVGVITRLIDMGVEPFLASSALSMAIAQRLVRTICPYCKTTITGERILELMHDDGISDEYIEKLGMEIYPHMSYAHGSGCDHCRNTGYFGRRPVFEVFPMTREARELINSDDFTDEALRELARKSGMTTLLSDGLRLVEEDVTTFPELIRVLGDSN